MRQVWEIIPIGEVRHSGIQAWVARLSAGTRRKTKPKSPAVVHRAHVVLFAILEEAVRDHQISSNPAHGVGLPRRGSRPHRYLTHEHLHDLAEQCGTHATLIRLLAYTGLRWGEVTALTVHDVTGKRVEFESRETLCS